MRRMPRAFVEGIYRIRVNPEATKRSIAKYMRMKDPKELDEAYEILGSLTQKNRTQPWRVSKISSLV